MPRRLCPRDTWKAGPLPPGVHRGVSHGGISNGWFEVGSNDTNPVTLGYVLPGYIEGQDAYVFDASGVLNGDLRLTLRADKGSALTHSEMDTNWLSSARVVNTITALKALSGNELSGTVFVLGYYTALDLGGGPYYWDSSSTSADNGGTVIRPATLPSTGRWKLKHFGMVSAGQFGAKFDGATDDITALTEFSAAIVGSNSGIVGILPPGTSCFTEVTADFGWYINGGPCTIIGAGHGKTTLKNISSSSSAAGIRCAGGFIVLRDFTLDQNNKTGIAFRQGGEYSKTDIHIKNQGGSNYACVIDGSTVADVDVALFSCTNGIDVGPTQATNYIEVNAEIEWSTGTALRIASCAGSTFDVEFEGAASDSAHTRGVSITNSEQVDIRLDCEIGATATISGDALIQVGTNNRALNFRGGRINVSSTGFQNKRIFEIVGAAKNAGIHFDGQEIIGTETGMTLFYVGGSVSPYNVTIENITTRMTAVATGVNCATAVQGMRVAQWDDVDATCSHTLDAVSLTAENVPGNIALTDRTNQTLINCSGTLSGTGATTCARINSSGTNDVVATGTAFRVADTQVLGARITGWTAASGTASRTSFDTATVTTEELAKRVKALIDDGITHGSIGA